MSSIIRQFTLTALAIAVSMLAFASPGAAQSLAGAAPAQSFAASSAHHVLAGSAPATRARAPTPSPAAGESTAAKSPGPWTKRDWVTVAAIAGAIVITVLLVRHHHYEVAHSGSVVGSP